MSSFEEHPENIVEKIKEYQPTAEYTSELNKISLIFSNCDESFMQKFINLFGVIKLMHALDVVQRSGPSQVDPQVKSEHLIRILTILKKIVSTNCGKQHFQKAYEMEPEESNLLRTFVSYLSLHNETANIILMDLINSLNESHNFAHNCIHLLKEPRPDAGNGVELLTQLVDTDNQQKIDFNNSIFILIKKITSDMPTDSELYQQFIIDLHDYAFIDKLGIIGDKFKNSEENKEYVNFVLELYDDLSVRYGKIDIE